MKYASAKVYFTAPNIKSNGKIDSWPPNEFIGLAIFIVGITKQKALNLEGFLFLQISVYASPLLTNNFSNNEGYPHMAIIKGA